MTAKEWNKKNKESKGIRADKMSKQVRDKLAKSLSEKYGCPVCWYQSAKRFVTIPQD